MSQAIVDPNELRRFANLLQRVATDTQSQMLSLRKQLHALGQSWRDQENDKFVAEFEQTLLAHQRFVEAAKDHVPFLIRKAERAEDYLRQR